MNNIIIRYFIVNRPDLAYVKFIFESYEGLATMSTLDNRTGTVTITFLRHFAEDIDGLLNALTQETAMMEIPPPNNGSAENHPTGGYQHA